MCIHSNFKSYTYMYIFTFTKVESDENFGVFFSSYFEKLLFWYFDYIILDENRILKFSKYLSYNLVGTINFPL